MLDNTSPFSKILDSCQDECFNLYAVVKSLCNYPDIFHFDYTDEDALLLATSFALLCERYIFTITRNEGNYVDDFESLHSELNFETPIDELESKLIECRESIIKDLKAIFSTKENILNLFASIFRMQEHEEPFIVDYFRVEDFYHNYF